MTDVVEGPVVDDDAMIPGAKPVAVQRDPDDRLTQNAAALVISGVLTSVLGFAFWVVAARVLSTDDVGTGTALVAALVLLANISSLGLRNAFPRFIPIAGATTARLVRRGYIVCASLAAVLAIGFAVGTPTWAPSLGLLHDHPFGAAGFVIAAAGWTIFILQDSVLTGLRRASWVPLENLVYAVGKIVLLVLVVSTGPWALLLAWAVPAIAVLAPLNVLLFKSLIPAHERRAAAAGRPTPSFDWRALTRFSIGEHAADVVKNFGSEGVILVVLAVAGSTQSAALFFGIMITSAIQLVTSNIVNAFVAETAARPAEIVTLLRRAAGHTIRLVVPAAVLGAIGAPIALSVFGSTYAENGTPVLRLLLLALIPQIVVSLAIGVARFERRVGLIFAIAVGTSIAPLSGALLLTDRYGVVAVGWAVLLGQSALALVLAGTVYRQLAMDVVPTGLIRRVVGVRDRINHRRRVRAVGSMLDELDAVHTTGLPLSRGARVRNSTDVVVVIVDHPEMPRVIKVALSPTAAYGLLDHAQALRGLHGAAAGDSDGALRLLPTVLEAGTAAGHSYLIETKCPGNRPLVADHGTMSAVAAALATVQRPTGVPTVVGDALIVSLVDDPIGILRADPRLAAYGPTLDLLRERLDVALRGQLVVTTRTHGDFWLGNVLAETVAGRVTVRGIIDWEDSQPVGLPEVDLAHLWLSTQHDGMACATLRCLDAVGLADALGSWIGPTPNPTLHGGTVVLLAWLAHISAGLDRTSKFSLGRLWLHDNVEPVLDALGAS